MKIIKVLCLMLIFISYDIKYILVKSSELGLLSGMTLNSQMENTLAKIRHRSRLRNRNGYEGRMRNRQREKNGNKFLKKEENASSSENRKVLNNVEGDTENNNLNNNPKSDYSNNTLQPNKKNDDIPDMPIYFQSWLKYLNFKETATGPNSKPKKFFKNDMFDVQQKLGKVNKVDFKSVDEIGNQLNIPSELHFYGVLYKNSLNILSSRDDTLQRTVDVLNIDYINPIPEEDHSIGGVRDFGSFSEGFCFRVLIKEPLEVFMMSQEQIEPKRAIDKKWVFCLDEQNKKNQLMNLLINLKLKKQHSLGVYLELDDSGKPKDETNQSLNTLAEKINGGVNKGKGEKDGYWMLLQDWSQCTLKCGGGLQYQQLMCIPPKEGGKPCQGPAIRTRPCNTQLCPTVQTKSSNNIPGLSGDNTTLNGGGNSTRTLPPILKQMTLSKRRNRYDKCVIKEDDALMIQEEMANSKIPVRIVLNDRTITIFQDESLENQISSFTIKDTLFLHVTNDSNCFKLKKIIGHSAQLCQLDSQKPGSWVEEWDYDYNLFKNQCYKKRSKSSVSLKIEDEKKVKEEFTEKVNEAKAELILKKKAEVAVKAQEEEEIQIQSKLEVAKQTSLQAIRKEIKLEQLIEAEEASKEEKEAEEIQNQIEHEERKNECLARAIKEKQLEDQFNLNKEKAEQTLFILASQTKKTIAEKRQEIKKKIAEMRRRQGNFF